MSRPRAAASRNAWPSRFSVSLTQRISDDAVKRKSIQAFEEACDPLRARLGRRAGLSRDPGADAVRYLVREFESRAAQAAVRERRGEGVARAYRVGDLDAEARVLRSPFGGYQKAPALTARDRDEVEFEPRE